MSSHGKRARSRSINAFVRCGARVLSRRLVPGQTPHLNRKLCMICCLGQNGETKAFRIHSITFNQNSRWSCVIRLCARPMELNANDSQLALCGEMEHFIAEARLIAIGMDHSNSARAWTFVAAHFSCQAGLFYHWADNILRNAYLQRIEAPQQSAWSMIFVVRWTMPTVPRHCNQRNCSSSNEDVHQTWCDDHCNCSDTNGAARASRAM